MITKLTITDDKFKTRIGRDVIDFSAGINILAGSNGSGKSSVLEAIKAEVDHGDQKIARLIRDPSVPVYNYFGEAATAKAVEAGGDQTDMTTLRQSHGQRLLSYLGGVKQVQAESTFLLDEPELALDYFAIEDLCKSMAQRPNIQFIVSSHHPLVFTLKNANIINMDRERSHYVGDVLKQLRKRLG